MLKFAAALNIGTVGSKKNTVSFGVLGSEENNSAVDNHSIRSGRSDKHLPVRQQQLRLAQFRAVH